MTELQHDQGGAITVKMTLIGRPGRVSNKGTFMLTMMQSVWLTAFGGGEGTCGDKVCNNKIVKRSVRLLE